MPDKLVILLPLTLKEVTLLSLQSPGLGWAGIVSRADAVRVNYLKRKRAMCDSNRQDCPECSGTGIGKFGDPNTSRCWHCHGRGYILVDNDSGRELQEDQREDDTN